MITPKHRMPQIIMALLTTALLGGGCDRRSADLRSGAGENPAVITALGRAVPGRAIISVAGQAGSRVLKLEVTEGQEVSAGEILATLDTYPLRLAESDEAKVALDEAREQLDAETTYGKALVEQNRETTRLLQVEVDRERRELKRMTSLASQRVVPDKDLDDQRDLAKTREVELEKAKAELRTAEAALVRARRLVGVQTAEAKVKAAQAQVELATVRAPIDGRILKVFTYPGEQIGDAPILQMGDTGDMHVIAEVRENDVRAIRIGQRATITSDALSEPVEGTVEEIGELIYKNDVLDPDPRADQDSRVVEVRVKVDDSASLAHLTRLEVYVRIQTAPTKFTAKSVSQ